MTEEIRLRSWWQKIKQHPVRSAIIIISTGAGALIVVVVLGYVFNWSWVGVNGGYPKITTKSIIVNGKPTNQDSEQAPAKTLWDYLQLLGVLAIPVVAGFGAAWFTAQQGKVSAAQNTDNQRETALQAYIDKMSELLLKEHLGELLPDGKADQKYRQQQNDNIKDELKPEYEAIRTIARVRTLTVLRGLDTTRKASVLQFLHESGLLDKNKLIINLNGADLSEADLRRANLSGDNLRGANLFWTDLIWANIREADLSGANLSAADIISADLSLAELSIADLSIADLSGANLSGANLRGANLSAAKLRAAKISTANLSMANLSGADLSLADLSGDDISGANISGAYLRWADLSGADLKDATGITTEELEKQAKSLKGATMPDGSIHP